MAEETRRPRPDAGAAVLLGTVLVSGAAVMVVEFLVVRILARDFGGALEVWASVISVLLAGLSLGYALGGWLAERDGTTRPISIALVLAGLLGLGTERIANAVGGWLLTLDTALALHPYVAALATSFLPIVALGTVVPQVIRLRAARTGHVGTAAGWTSGLSTLGSILGVMLTVHVLLPRVGLRESLYATSAVLLLNAAVLALPRRRGAIAALALVFACQPGARAQVLYDNYSAYHHIIVQDIRSRRLLRFDSAVQSLMSVHNPNTGGFEYTDFFHVPIVLKPGADRALFLGLGGGTGPKAFLRDYPDMQVDVVEIDSTVEKLARAYFYLPDDPRLDVTIQDGRVFLQRNRTRYDVIVMDAYASSRFGAYLPQHLATKEFFELTRDRLQDEGSLVYNVASESVEDEKTLAAGIYATLRAVFRVVYVFDARSSYNIVFIAQKHATDEETAAPVEPPVLLDRAALRDRAKAMVDAGQVKLRVLPQRIIQFAELHGTPPTGTVYTDNFAPVDLGRAR